ncbi:MAG: alpha-L-glutamate ligase-like protein [Parvibaculum sp.]
MFLARYSTLRKHGVVGLNQRNISLIQKLNRRELYPLVDNKLKTKDLAIAFGIPVPKLLGLIEEQHSAEEVLTALPRENGFVIKPGRGSGGKGVMVLTKQRVDRKGVVRYQKSNGRLIEREDVLHHISNIISGLYSLGGTRDGAMVEELVKPHPFFDPIAWEGLPDVRIVVMKGYPIMAMIRLPTSQSQGRANLHQGAVGVGINIATGIMTSGVQFNHQVTEHPDTLNEFRGMHIPQWRKQLDMAASCYELTGLGYLGCDIILDAERGPLLLELNARPGLNIQIANNQGLGINVAKAHEWADLSESVTERTERAIVAFGGGEKPAED